MLSLSLPLLTQGGALLWRAGATELLIVGICPSTIINHLMDKSKGPKAHWDSVATRIFCEICRDEVLTWNRPLATLNGDGYKNLIEKFNFKTGRDYDRSKMKNKWDAMKKEYNIWLDLKKAPTGLGWDVTNGTITANDEWWKEKIEANKDYDRFRTRPMDNLNEQEVMFQNIHVSSASSVVPGVPRATHNVDDVVDLDDDDGVDQPAKRKGDAIAPSPKKRHPMVREVKRLVDVIASSNSVTSQQNDKINDDIIEHIRQVVKCGAAEGSDEHFIATKLFIKQEYRDVWRSFETNEGRMMWLKKKMYEERRKN